MKTSINARDLRKSQTNAEKLLWAQLRNRRFLGIKFRRQKLINGYIVDFVSLEKNLIIELDGYYHKNKNSRRQDLHRTEVLNGKGYIVLRFWNGEILKDMNIVLKEIQNTLYPSPYLSPEGRGEMK